MDVISRIAMGQKGSKFFCNEYMPVVKKIFEIMDSNQFIYNSWKFPRLAPLMGLIAKLTGTLRKDPFTLIGQLITKAVLERKKLREQVRFF